MNSAVYRGFVGLIGLAVFLCVVDVRSSGVPTLTVSVARADDSFASASYAILKCFHPTAIFISGDIGPTTIDANGRTAAHGKINFRGALSGNSYRMTYVVHVKVEDRDTMVRITPLLDDAPFPPSSSCSLREWTRVD